MGEAAACVKEADALDSARGVLPNPARANERYERAIRLFDADCDTGNREACQALVAINRRVRPILLTDRALAIRFHGRVCETGGGDACVQAARLLDRRGGPVAELQRAADLYERGCESGDLASCERGIEMFRGGQGLPASPGRAAMLELTAAELRKRRRQ